MAATKDLFYRPDSTPIRKALGASTSHDWGPDSANHTRVVRVVEALRERGVDVWFDENHVRLHKASTPPSQSPPQHV